MSIEAVINEFNYYENDLDFHNQKTMYYLTL